MHTESGGDTTFEWRDISFEVHWALVDWGVIWGNPTLYLEYKFMSGQADVIERKILLGGEIAPGWHWALNLVFEGTVGSGEHNRAREYELTGAIHYTLIDSVLSIGLSFKTSYVEETEDGEKSYGWEFNLGPAIQWRPMPKAHLDIAPLFGLTEDSKRVKLFIVFGWDF